MTRLNVQQVRKLLVRAVEEKGADYVYVNPKGESPEAGRPFVDCMNFDPETRAPSCIAGHVYYYMGLDLDELEIGDTVVGLNSERDIFDGEAEQALARAQNAQDSGKTWGEALTAFDAYRGPR